MTRYFQRCLISQDVWHGREDLIDAIDEQAVSATILFTGVDKTFKLCNALNERFVLTAQLAITDLKLTVCSHGTVGYY